MLVTSNPQIFADSTLAIDQTTYVSWAVTNGLSSDLDRTFFVDVLFDGVMAERWRTDGVRAGFLQVVTAWPGLNSLVDLTAGAHTIKVIVDSTNLIEEINELDNSFERIFIWGAGSGGNPAPAPPPEQLPDFTPFTPDGWTAPIVATSYAGDVVDGPLSVDVPTYIQYPIHNTGLASTPSDVWVYLYLDDVLVRRDQVLGLLAEQTSTVLDWSELFDVTPVAPGTHTLRVVIDPNGLLAESDETNNSFEKQFTWGTGAVAGKPAAVASSGGDTPQALTLPNLRPSWRFGSDGPIVVSERRDTGLDGPLGLEGPWYVDLRVWNESGVAAPPFSVDLFFDGTRVRTFRATAGLDPAFTVPFLDWDGLDGQVSLTPGPHTLRLMIDPTNEVPEASETDNVFEKVFVWAVEQPSPPAPTVYSSADLQGKLAPLAALLKSRDLVRNGSDAGLAQQVIDVVDAGYYLMTGASLLDERVDIHLLSRADYKAWIDDDYREQFALSEESEHAAILARREGLKSGAVGFKTRRFGKIAIVIDAERVVPEVLDTFAHEVGHMRQDLVNPAQTEFEGSLSLIGLQEAGAQQFQRTFWLTLERSTGLPILAYPDYTGFRRFLDERLDRWQAERAADEHSLGFLLQWLAVLDDPALAGLRGELLEAGQLGQDRSAELFDFFVDMDPAAAESYVDARLSALSAHAGLIAALAKARLEHGLDPGREGSAFLREPALLTP